MRRRLLFLMLSVGTLIAARSSGGRADPPPKNDDAQPRMNAFEAAVYRNDSNETLPYRLLLPKDFRRDGDGIKSTAGQEKYPLVLFLHGLGERGTDNARQLTHGVLEFAKPAVRDRYPCFVAAPQCPANDGWVKLQWQSLGKPLSDKPTPALRLALELVDHLAATLPIDADRIYITGLSMGGFGTWDAVVRRPERFAAAVPVCGGGDPDMMPKLKNLPIWAFHGEKDAVVPPARSIAMIDALRQAGGQPKLTLYPGVGHDSWRRAYAEPELMAWLFAQKLKK